MVSSNSNLVMYDYNAVKGESRKMKRYGEQSFTKSSFHANGNNNESRSQLWLGITA